MILHLVVDDKFIDYAIRQFTTLPTKSEFLFVTNQLDYKFKYIHNHNVVKLMHHDDPSFKKLLNHLDEYSCIITHGLFESWQYEIIQSAPKSVHVAWVFWGGEIYGRAEFKKIYYSVPTKVLHKFYNIKHRVHNYLEVPAQIFQRINFCLTDIYEELLLVNKIFHCSMKFLWYNYYSIEETLGNLINSRSNGSNILIGNSASFENNHLSAFHLIRNEKLQGRDIIVPLSYGNSWLRSIMNKIGFLYFGKHFKPINTFIDLNSYNKILQSCDISIMPHYRQQAFGNIITLMWLGVNVYLFKENILVSYFTRLGCCFSIIEDELIGGRLILRRLTEEQIVKNREILYNHYANQKVLNKIQFLTKELTS